MISDDNAFLMLKRRIFTDRGLDCEQYKENYLKRRIAVRLRATGAKGYLDYLNLLKKNPEEYTHLLDEITVNVTQFFRDADVYEKLRSAVIPRLLKAKETVSSRTIRIWSAGCSSGEEAYSIAILFDDTLGKNADKWNVRVLGSDYDDRSLKVARAGTYQDLELPKNINASRYFTVTSSGSGTEYRVRDEVRGKVRFEKINLLEHEPRRHYDIVLCRNVLIYFGREVQAKFIQALAGSIMGEGYLVLGKSETVGPEVSRVLKPIFPVERIYQLVPEPRLGVGRGRNG